MLRLVVLVASTAALQLPQSALQAHPTRPAALPQSAQAQRAPRRNARRAALSAATLFANAPALLDVRVTRDAVSPDGRSGLAWVPDRQALAAWDDAEKAMLKETADA